MGAGRYLQGHRQLKELQKIAKAAEKSADNNSDPYAMLALLLSKGIVTPEEFATITGRMQER